MKRTPKKRRYTPEYIKELQKELIIWIENPDNFWLGDFAIKNKMARARLQELACQNEEFGEAYDYAKSTQESRIVQLAIHRKIDCTMAIFALKNVAGWRDKQDQDQNGERIAITIITQNNPQHRDSSPRIQVERASLAAADEGGDEQV